MRTIHVLDKSNIRFRQIHANEISLLVDYRMMYLSELQGKMSKAFQEELREKLSDYFERALREKRFVAFLAELNSKPIAFGGMVIKEIPGDAQQSSYFEGDILNMYTIPEARRQGISSVLLENLLNEAKRLGISKVALHTSKDGEKLYRKFGFSEPQYPYLERIIE